MFVKNRAGPKAYCLHRPNLYEQTYKLGAEKGEKLVFE